jgi:DnaK suppressor protein
MLDTLFIEKIQGNLILERKKLLLQTGQDQDIEIDVDGDDSDEVQGNLLISIQNKLNARNLQKLTLIDEALQRIKDNVYGICEDCGEQIPEKRLLFNPCISTCVDCASDREVEQKQRKRD